MKIALIQHAADHDKSVNVRRGLEAMEQAARSGAELVVFAELAFERFIPNVLPLRLPGGWVNQCRARRRTRSREKPESWASSSC
jgi:hypothetical protein